MMYFVRFGAVICRQSWKPFYFEKSLFLEINTEDIKTAPATAFISALTTRCNEPHIYGLLREYYLPDDKIVPGKIEIKDIINIYGL